MTAPYDWSTDPEAAELLLDPYRASAEALAAAARQAVDELGPYEGDVPDDCPTCTNVARLRSALAGYDLAVGSEER